MQGGYQQARFNEARACNAFITQQCTQERGTDVCLQEQIAAQQQAKHSNTILIAVLVPVGLTGGCKAIRAHIPAAPLLRQMMP
jgi:hypothetical protein